MKSVFDRTFAYTPSVRTDIRKTFQRERKRIREEKEAEAAKPRATVRTIKGAK